VIFAAAHLANAGITWEITVTSLYSVVSFRSCLFSISRSFRAL
jgi:hypothetical protein